MVADGLDRRAFVARLASLAALPPMSVSSATAWRAFEIVTEVDLGDGDGPARLWLPLPLADDTPYQRTRSVRLDTTAGRHWVMSHPGYRLRVQCCAWAEARGPRQATLTAVIATRDRAGAAAPVASGGPSELARYLRPTRLLPTTGIVRDTADAIVRGARGDEARARRLYDWIVDNTFRDPAVEGCGLGDIRWMLETKNLGGKRRSQRAFRRDGARRRTAGPRRLRLARRPERGLPQPRA